MNSKTISYTFPDGRVYVGAIKNNRPDGIGTMTFPNGDVFEGSWIDGCMDGEGVYRFYDANKDKFSSEYSGTFRKNIMDGQGKRVYADKTLYIGTWQNGMRTGNGACWFADGSYFYGIWKFDKMIRGIFHLSSGDIFDGELKDDIFNGFGKYTWREDGVTFEGLFKDGKPFKGVKIFPDKKVELIDDSSVNA